MEPCLSAIIGVGSNQPVCATYYAEIVEPDRVFVNHNTQYINQPIGIISACLSICVFMWLLFNSPEPVL